jgi:hypothetical protein
LISSSASSGWFALCFCRQNPAFKSIAFSKTVFL